MRRCVSSAVAVLVVAFVAAVPASGQDHIGDSAVDGPQPRIVNGSSGVLLPWQVAIVPVPRNPQTGEPGSTIAINPVQVFCGGTIRDATHVISAAHCFEDFDLDDPEEIAVVSGFQFRSDHTIEGTWQISGVTRLTTHPSFVRSSEGFDVALLTLGQSLPNNVNTQPRPVIAANASSDGNIAVVSGWGTTSSGGDQPDGLQYAYVDVDSGGCGNYGTAFKPSTMLCASRSAGNGTAFDSCQGDSGGPLVRYDGDVDLSGGTNPPDFTTLIGVVSFGRGCGDLSFPGIYTRLAEPSTRQVATDLNPQARVTRLGGPIVSGTSSLVTCGDARWGNEPLTSRTRLWFRANDATGNGIVELAGQTGATYAPDSADVGKFLACDERGTNAGGSLVQGSAWFAVPAAAPAPAPTPAPTATPIATPTPTPTPAPDPDGDGISTADRCPALARGAFDVDRDGCPGPFKELKVSFAVDKDRTGRKLFALRLSGIPRGARVTVRCASCTSSRRTVTVKAPVTASRLTKALRRLRGVSLARRTFTITATAPGYVGKVGTLRFSARRSLRISARCLQPGSAAPRRTCDTTPGLPGGTVEI